MTLWHRETDNCRKSETQGGKGTKYSTKTKPGTVLIISPKIYMATGERSY